MFKLDLGKTNITGVLLKTQNSILSATFVLAVASGINAVFGFLKGRVLAHYFGVSNDLAVFYTADRLPSLIYSVLIVGAVSTVFIPVFTSQLKSSKDEAYKTASSIINGTLLFFGVFAILLYFLAPQVISLLTLGKFSPAEMALGVNLLKIMLLAQLILVIGSLITSVLQSYQMFLFPAFAPVAYNIGMLVCTILFANKLGIYAPALGVLVGSMLHVLIQIPAMVHTKFKYTFLVKLTGKGPDEVLHMVPPRIISVLLTNVASTINNSLAILVSPASVIYLKFASQLETFPVTLIALSMASACLPALASESEQADKQKFRKTFSTSFMQMMFLIMPMATILLVLRVPAVRIVYGVPNFPWEATIKTALVLGIYSLSIPAQSANYLISRAFYALKDTLTPVIVSIAVLVINLGGSLVLVLGFNFGIWSIALAYTIATCAESCVLAYLLNKKIGGLTHANFVAPLSKIMLSAMLMGITLYVPIKLLDKVFINTEYTFNLLLLTGFAGACGVVTYLVFTKLLRVEEINLFYSLLGKLNLRQVKIAENVVGDPEG